MTEQELHRVPFRFVSHLSMEGEHCTTYESVPDGRLGFCDHVPMDHHGQPHGRSRRHYRIDGNVYKSRKKFLEALKEFNFLES